MKEFTEDEIIKYHRECIVAENFIISDFLQKVETSSVSPLEIQGIAKEINLRINEYCTRLKSDMLLECKAKAIGEIILSFYLKAIHGNELYFDSVEGFYEEATIANINTKSVGIIWNIEKEVNRIQIKPIGGEFVGKIGDTILLLLITGKEIPFLKTVLSNKDFLLNSMQKIGTPHLFDIHKVTECEYALGIKNNEYISKNMDDRCWIGTYKDLYKKVTGSTNNNDFPAFKEKLRRTLPANGMTLTSSGKTRNTKITITNFDLRKLKTLLGY